jgi:hypothetical protein
MARRALTPRHGKITGLGAFGVPAAIFPSQNGPPGPWVLTGKHHPSHPP